MDLSWVDTNAFALMDGVAGVGLLVVSRIFCRKRQRFHRSHRRQTVGVALFAQ